MTCTSGNQMPNMRPFSQSNSPDSSTAVVAIANAETDRNNPKIDELNLLVDTVVKNAMTQAKTRLTQSQPRALVEAEYKAHYKLVNDYVELAKTLFKDAETQVRNDKAAAAARAAKCAIDNPSPQRLALDNLAHARHALDAALRAYEETNRRCRTAPLEAHEGINLILNHMRNACLVANDAWIDALKAAEAATDAAGVAVQ